MLTTIGSDILDLGSRKAAGRAQRRRQLTLMCSEDCEDITGSPGQFDVPNVPDVSYSFGMWRSERVLCCYLSSCFRLSAFLREFEGAASHAFLII